MARLARRDSIPCRAFANRPARSVLARLPGEGDATVTGDPAVTSPDFSETVQLLRRAKAGEGDCLHQVLLRYRTRLLDRIRRGDGNQHAKIALPRTLRPGGTDLGEV